MLYLGETLKVCFLETVLRDNHTDRSSAVVDDRYGTDPLLEQKLRDLPCRHLGSDRYDFGSHYLACLHPPLIPMTNSGPAVITSAQPIILRNRSCPDRKRLVAAIFDIDGIPLPLLMSAHGAKRFIAEPERFTCRRPKSQTTITIQSVYRLRAGF